MYTYIFLEAMLILSKISLTPFDSIFLICYIFKFFFNIKKAFKIYVFCHIHWKILLSRVVISLIPVLFFCLLSQFLASFFFPLPPPSLFFFLFFVIVDCELVFSTS